MSNIKSHYHTSQTQTYSDNKPSHMHQLTALSLATKAVCNMRPYHYVAYSYDKHLEVANYLKGLEPEEFHNLDVKLAKLQDYTVSNDLLAFLQGSNLCIELSEYEFYPYPKEVEFLPLIDTIETEFQGRKLLLITTDIDGASCELVWDFESKCIGYVDIEHEYYNTVCSFAEFIENPTDVVSKVVSGEYAD